MKSFSIDPDNSITAFAKSKDAEGASGEAFHSEAELHRLTAGWPASRLVEVWNGIPGFTRIKRFTDRKTAVARIWKAIQSLEGGVGAQGSNVAPGNAVATPQTRPAHKRVNAKQTAKNVNPLLKPQATTPGQPRSTKTAQVLAMLRRSQGATLKQLMRATGWQAHSVRGFISGTVGKKMGLAIASAVREDGQRCYSVSA